MLQAPEIWPSESDTQQGLCSSEIGDISNITLPPCASCENKCGNTSDLYKDRGCSCDSICVLNRDCCPDFKVKCPQEYESSQYLYLREKPSCVNTNFPQAGIDNNYLLVSKCKMNQTKCLVSNETPNMLIPVYDRDSQQHFVNTNCAICHDMCLTYLVPWQMDVICPDLEESGDFNTTAQNNSLTWEKIQKGICDIQMYPSNDMVQPRKCMKEVKRSCPERCANHTAEKDCLESDLMYIDGNKTTYANIACKYCNEGPNEEHKCHQNYLIEESRVKRSVGKFSFQMLFDIDPRKGMVIGGESLGCSSGDDCDLHSNMICGPLPFYEITFQINVTRKYQNVTTKFMDKVRMDLNENITSEFGDVGVFIDVTHYNIWTITIYVEWETEINETSLEEAILEYFSVLFEDDSIAIVNKTRKLSNNLDCVTKEYTELDYEQESNKTIKIKEDGRRVNSDKYFIQDKIAFVCIEEWLNVGYPESFGIVTIICTSISILALITRLILHCIVPQGSDQSTNKFRISLTVALLSAMVSFILHPLVKEIPKLCYVVSVWIHWSFLTAFSWMTAIAVDITRMLTATMKLKRIDHNFKTLLVYSIIAWGIPTILVAFTVGMDYTRISWYWRPHYGETVCWISSRYALLAYFVAPVAAAIAINIFLFITSSILLFKLQAGSASTDNRGLKDRLILHVKLLILMGLTWLFGFLAAPLRSNALWYIFIVLNASQGVYLLLIYIFSSQFRTYINDVKHKKDLSSSLPAQQTVDTGL